MATIGQQVRAICQCQIVFEDGMRSTLFRGQNAGAFADFVARSPDGGEGVEVLCNHPETGQPAKGVVAAMCVTIVD